jgi:hypothetical protein
METDPRKSKTKAVKRKLPSKAQPSLSFLQLYKRPEKISPFLHNSAWQDIS